MLDLIVAPLAAESKGLEEAASLFIRNFRVHSGIPIAVADSESQAQVALVYGDCSPASLRPYAERYRALVALPALASADLPLNCDDSYSMAAVEVPLWGTAAAAAASEFVPFMLTGKGRPLVLEGRLGKTPVVLFAVDLISESHRLLTGQFEAAETDEHGRQNPPPFGVYRTPAVSFHFNLIESAIRRLYAALGLCLLSIPRWPGSAPMALFLSHDIDAVKKWTPKRVAYELVRSAIRGRDVGSTLRSVGRSLRGRDPYWNFDELLQLEEGFGFPSTWFFAPFGGDYTRRTRRIDPVYRRRSAELVQAFDRIRGRNCEIGLHGVREAFIESAELRRQLVEIAGHVGSRVDGIRYHFLMFQHGSTFEAVDEVGLRYDASRGFSDRAGFRDGMATPYFPFPELAGNLIELPLHCMDGLFLHTGDDAEVASGQAMEAYHLAKAAGGMFSFLLHPGCLDPLEIPGLDAFYRALLSGARQDRCLGMTGRQLSDWWTGRELVLGSLEYSPGRWKIAGVTVPAQMEFAFTAPAAGAQVVLETGVGEERRVNGELVIHPRAVDPEQGITFCLG